MSCCLGISSLVTALKRTLLSQPHSTRRPSADAYHSLQRGSIEVSPADPCSPGQAYAGMHCSPLYFPRAYATAFKYTVFDRQVAQSNHAFPIRKQESESEPKTLCTGMILSPSDEVMTWVTLNRHEIL